MTRKLVLAAGLLAGASLASAADFNLGNYHLAGDYAIDMLPGDGEASAVTWDRATGTLFALGDEGLNITQIDTTGQRLSTMAITGFKDTEGLTAIGNNQFVITEERRRQAFLFTYAPGTTLAKTGMLGSQLDPTLGDSPKATTNIGIEGISYDSRDGSFIYVKEKGLESQTPPQGQEVKKVTAMNFGVVNSADNVSLSSVAIRSDLFTPNLGALDLSDVQVLANSFAFANGPDADNLLVLSQESKKLYEVTRTGQVLSMYNLGAGLAASYSVTEGVTVDDAGNIYLVDEGADGAHPHLLVLSSNVPVVPLPASAWLMLSGLGALVVVSRRRRKLHTAAS